jgi:8-oxo-dGTP pyrophosphatase MutT (NUDIX family)
MATNSIPFPLHNSIRKILDDPNSRPALPGLDEGSTVGDGNFGKGDRYNTGKWSDIALNNGNVVVEVHNTTDSKSLYYHVGKVNGGKIDWDENQYYDKGVRPSVAINNNGLVVEVHKSQGLKNTFWHRLGQVEGGTIKWRNNDTSTEYGAGLEPSVAITDDELVVEVHQSIIHDEGSGQLYYQVGRVKGDTIDWGESHYYDNGVQPSVAITNDGLVVEVHTSQNFNTLYYHVGRVKGDNTIDWGESHYYNDGVYPSVAITNDGLVVEVHQSQSHNTLWYRGTGQVNSNTIDDWDDKKKSKNFGDGTTPRVACNGQLAVETHSGADNQLLSSVLTLPAFRGKWIGLEGDNSYCYCACNRASDNKDRHASSHTMNVKEGAPYLCAILTKDDDSIDFPTGAVLTIEGPDGTKYDRDIEDENQLVTMSGSSVRCLIVKDPKPGDWKMTMVVPEGVGFHCECTTVPSKDVYDTMTETLGNSLQKRGFDDLTSGWFTGLGGILFPGLPDESPQLEPLYTADFYDATSYGAVGESGDTAEVDLSKAEKQAVGVARKGFIKSLVEKGGVKKTIQTMKTITKTTTKKKKKGDKKYVYAVAYNDQGDFLLAGKTTRAYFFHELAGGGIIIPAGKIPHGSGKYALPGGELDWGSAEAAAIREFEEETDVKLEDFNFTMPIQPYEGTERLREFELKYYGVYFNVGARLPQLVDTVSANLDSGNRAVEAVKQGNYGPADYQRLRTDFPGCPQDNELRVSQLWNLHLLWDTISLFQSDQDLSWFYYILNNLRNQLGTRVSSLQQFADR